MGTNYSAQIAQQLPLIRDPEALRYINVLGDSLAKVTDQRDLQWHFNIVDSKEVSSGISTSWTARRSTRSRFRAATCT